MPALPLVAATAIVFSLALMATLPGDTWIRRGIWAALGLCVYFLYARAHSKERMDTISRRHHQPARTGSRGRLSVSVHLLRAPKNDARASGRNGAILERWTRLSKRRC